MSSMKRRIAIFLAIVMTAVIFNPVCMLADNSEAVSTVEASEITEEEPSASFDDEKEVDSPSDTGMNEEVSSESSASEADENDEQDSRFPEETANTAEAADVQRQEGTDAEEIPGKEAAETTDDNPETTDETEVVEEAPFEETGVFGCYTVDNYGTTISSFYNEADKTYYLFLTNTGSVFSFPVFFTGVKPVEVSRGEVDIETYSIPSGAFENRGDALLVTDKDGNQYTVVALQSSLPSLCVSLNGVTLDYIDSHGKEAKYTGNSLILIDENGELVLSQDSTVEIKGRGNTTWNNASKKAYQIKFSKKQSVLGMPKAKKWILLANAFDDSLVRCMTAFSRSDEIGMEFVVDYRYVDLWIDGQYRGTYMIGEKNEINENRLNLTDPYGILVELDNGYYREEEYWFKEAVYGNYFVAKEVVDEDTPGAAEKALKQFQTRMEQFTGYLSGTAASAITLNSLSNYIDVESWAKWYIVHEFFCNIESNVTSCMLYMDGASDVIHMGPVWDFDSSMGNRAYTETNRYYFRDNNYMYNKLLKVPEFAAYVKNMIKQYDGNLADSAVYAAGTAAKIEESANMNYTRWDVLGKPNQKSETEMLPFAATYKEAVDSLVSWLEERYKFFTGKTDIEAYIEGKNLIIRVNDHKRLSGVNIASWTKANGQKDLKWSAPGRSSDGLFKAVVPLSQFVSAGKVLIHVYGDGVFQKEAVVDIPVPQVSYDVSEDGKTLTLTADGAGIFDTLQTAVWTKTNGQDDLVWYTLKPDGEKYTAVVNLLSHGKSDTYYFHTYGKVNGRSMFVSADTRNIVMNLPKPEVILTKNEANTLVTAVVKNAETEKNVRLGVWGAENGQNDLKWYTASKQADGTWKAEILLSSHRETGTLYADCWTAKGYLAGSTIQLAFEEEEEKPAEKPEFTVTVSEDGSRITCSLTNTPKVSGVRFPAWTNENGQDDLVWYNAKNDGKGNWSYTISTANHGGNGEYIVHCYSVTNGVLTAVGGRKVNVKTASVKPYVTAAKAGNLMKAQAVNASAYTNVRFAVWTSEFGQDDLRWYTASKNAEGSWACSFSPAAHTPGAALNIHVYGYLNGKNTFIGAAALAK